MLAFAEERNQACARERCVEDFDAVSKHIHMVHSSCYGKCKRTGNFYLPSCFDESHPAASLYLPEHEGAVPLPHQEWPKGFSDRDDVPPALRGLKDDYCWACWKHQVERRQAVAPILEALLLPSNVIECILDFRV